MSTEKRQPKGIPTGGEFAAHDRSDADISLTGDSAAAPRAGALNRPVVPGPYTISAYRGAGIGREGPMWSAKLLRDGKHVADLIEEGSGGELLVRYRDRGERELAEQYAQKWTHRWGQSEYSPDGYAYDVATVFGELAENVRVRSTLNRQSKKGLLIMASPDGSPEDGYFTTNIPDTADGRAAVKAKYPDAVVWDGDNWVPVG